MYNNNYSYWTMTPSKDTEMYIIYLDSSFDYSSVDVKRYDFTVRLVSIILSKTVLD